MLETAILQEDIPTVYDLAVGQLKPDLLVRIHPQAYDFLVSEFSKVDSRGQPIVNRRVAILRHDLKIRLPEFIPPRGSEAWGFGEVLQSLPDTIKDWVTLRCNLPPVSKIEDWINIYALSASLNTLFFSLNNMTQATTAESFQLLHTNLITGMGDYGCSIRVNIAKAMILYLASKGSLRDIKTEEVMRRSYEVMVGSRMARTSSFYVRFEEPYLVRFMSGSASGLNPEMFTNFRSGKGYELVPDNIDGPIQQMTLLMGVAAMYDEARKAGF